MPAAVKTLTKMTAVQRQSMRKSKMGGDDINEDIYRDEAYRLPKPWSAYEFMARKKAGRIESVAVEDMTDVEFGASLGFASAGPAPRNPLRVDVFEAGCTGYQTPLGPKQCFAELL